MIDLGLKKKKSKKKKKKGKEIYMIQGGKSKKI